MNILVTGGAGYIGSHTLVELLNENHNVVVVDNFSNSSEEPLRRVEKLTGKSVRYYACDVLDKAQMSKVFIRHKFDAVIHFAGLKAVGESFEQPLNYFTTNISGTLVLCELMAEFGVKNLVFSSSATVYGTPRQLPIDESFPTSVNNPYGQSKLSVEFLLKDLARCDEDWNITILRYFNPVGAHPSGEIGEDPKGVPSNILPYIAQVAIGKFDEVKVFGGDYDTEDGTGVRDYIHVVDLARGHVKAIEHIKHSGLKTYNLGTGKGYSVMELIATYEKVSQRAIPFSICARREGDVAACYSSPDYAEKSLAWKACYGIEDMLRHSWRWQSKNPDGYRCAYDSGIDNKVNSTNSDINSNDKIYARVV
ncbi:UDP-glucose 4-epimerase GalE [Agaribacterium haliotis]|uniref:UDP-glucose 4-epimerase GalE n=1 Tax=Agaribacterium haliotis TaxID=2013869 RepID=UPI000BB541D7|nr:UDP-glucose 4-epimerase GalE [Agaribacterium haliotis]